MAKHPGLSRARLGYSLSAVCAGLGLWFGLLSGARAAAAGPAAPRALVPSISTSLHNDTSAPLAALAAAAGPATGQSTDAINRVLPLRAGDPLVIEQLKADGIDYLAVDDPVIQGAAPSAVGALLAPLHNFEGLGNADNLAPVSPPDTVGDIGYDPATGQRYYLQWVNQSLAIWEIDPEGGQVRVVGPVSGNALFAGFSGPGGAGSACRDTNDGDPIVLFDAQAGRWLASQFALPNFPAGPFYQCLAVSATADPTGAWHRYAFLASNTKMNDYPHFGVWPDGYYMSINQFTAVSLASAGAGAWVFERDQLLAGQPARAVSFDLSTVNLVYGGQLPADLDGLALPPPGSPNYFVEVDDNTYGLGPDALRVWEFHVDWSVPTASTFGDANGQPNVTLPVQSFTLLCPNTRNCVRQPGTFVGLDAVADRLMHRLAYRNFGTHEALVFNHTVNAGDGLGGSRAGVRWYEVRDPGGTPTLFQEGTFAPADGQERWMASIAQDHVGNLALGYNVSDGSTVYPSIRYAGRAANDPLGTLPLGEVTLAAGTGSYNSTNNRWGDYSSLTVDPVDDCTFWLTAEYMATNSTLWRTRIGSFRFDTCSLGPRGTLAGTVTEAGSGQPLAGALVTASTPTQTLKTTTGPAGGYALSLAPGTYTVTAAFYGYAAGSAYPVTLTEAVTTTLDLPLAAAPLHTLTGVVTDAGTGQPLWATLTLAGAPFDPPITTYQTDAATGTYSLTVPGGGQAYTLTATALLHLPLTRTLGVVDGDRVENFALIATTTAGAMAGYVTSDFLAGPVAGAVVTVSAAGQVTAATDASGYYQVLPLAPGAYTVTAGAAAHTAHTVPNVPVLTSAITRQDLTLTTGRATLAAGGLSRTLGLGAVLTEPAGLVLTNTGAGVLAYQWREQAVGFTPAGPGAPQGGGPDPFGYTWRASTELGGPVFEWIDATDGTALSLLDDGAASITLPFPLAFYSSTSASLRVSNNGGLLFNSTNATLGFTNEALAATNVRNLIAPLWDDLYDDSGAVYWKVVGATPNRRVVVEWHNRPHWAVGDGVGAVTFEVVLFEDGDILFQYLDVDFGSASFNLGASATVGLRGFSTGHLLQYSHNTPALADNLALCFDRPGGTACGLGDALPWVDVAPLAGSLPGGVGAAQPFSLTWRTPVTAVMPGQYRGNLWLVSSDPAGPNLYVPLTLTVQPPAVRFSSAAQTVTEAQPVTVTVSLEHAAGMTVTAPYAVSGTAAGSGVDHNLAGGSLVFAPGELTRTLAFKAGLDPLTEADETVVITLGAPANALLGEPAQHTVTILDLPLPHKLYFPLTR